MKDDPPGRLTVMTAEPTATGHRSPWSRSPWGRYPSAAELDASTPDARDRVVDLVRGLSLAVMVFGHSFMALVVFKGTHVELSNTLAQTRALQPATWLLQIMPLFFAAGAWANALSYRKATSYPVWLSARVRRLLRPVLLYVGFWVVVPPLLLGWNSDISLPLLRLSTQLLWFLGVYLLVTALTPLLVRFAAHPWAACLGWLAGAAAVDVGALAGAPQALRLLNFVLVWALAGQTGLWVFSPVHRPDVRRATALAVGCIAADALLVGFGPWPLSLVGLPDERISNMAPPSIVMALHAVTLAAVTVLTYRWLARLAARPRVWRATVVVNAAAMTVYLWHLVALILALLTLRALSLDLVGYSSPGWLGPRLLFWAVFVVYTFALVWFWRPFEHMTLPWWDAPPRHSLASGWPYRIRSALSVVGAAAVAVSLLALSVTGMVGFPFNSSTNYAGLSFTPGLAVAVALLGMLLARVAAVGDVRPGRSVSVSARG